MNVETGDEKPGQPGDESNDDAEGPRFLGQLRKLVQRRAGEGDSGQPGDSTMAKPDGT